MSLPERYISFARILLIFFRKGGLQPLQPPASYADGFLKSYMSVFPLKIKRNGQRNEFKVHHGWIFSYKSTDRFNCYSHSRFCAWVGHYLRLASKKSNSQVRTNLRQKRTGKSSLKVTCILTMKSKVRFRKVAFARGHKNDQNRKLTLTFSLWWLLSHAEAGMKKGK